MDQNTLHRIEAHCTQEAMPRCQAHCPLHLDVRAFMANMQKGNLNEARKIMDRHMPIPQILAYICDHPCENHCLRRDLGGSLAIQSLEELCVQHTQKQIKTFPRPPKTQKIAVFGNGLAGMTVAYELAKKSFPVTVFYEDTAKATANTFLCTHFPKLPPEAVQQEWDQLQKQHITLQAAPLTVDFFTSVHEDFHAFFVDAHAAAALFTALGQEPETGTMHMAQRQDIHLCAGGMPENTPTGESYFSPAKQCGEGRCAALSLERLATGVSLHAGREDSLGKSNLYTPLQGIEPLAAIFAHHAEQGYTLEEARAEAARCIQCQCMQCVKECVYLQKYGSFPRAYTRQIYNNTAIVLGDHKANSLINGCMLCDQCTEICPERFSMPEVCLDARQHMVENNYMPPSAFEFALEDMLSASQSPCTLLLADSTQAKPSHAFFPGCQLAATRGDQVLAIYEMLRNQKSLPHIQGVGLMLSCCAIAAHWAGEKAYTDEAIHTLKENWRQLQCPTLIMACASCMKMFSLYLPHIPCISLWEVLSPLMASPKEVPALACSLHDPCAARNNTAWQEAITNLATQHNVHITPHRHQGKTTPCCGFGGNIWCSQPELAAEATKNLEHLLYTENEQDISLVSCVMCQERLLQLGKQCLHILDILPDLPPVQAKPLGISARRAQRAALVEKAQQQYDPQDCLPCKDLRHPQDTTLHIFAEKDAHLFLHIAPQLLHDLERRHILHQDVALTVQKVEEHKACFVEQESGHRIGAYRPRNVTFWVRYSQDTQGKYHLHDAWCHRMHVPNSFPENEKG